MTNTFPDAVKEPDLHRCEWFLRSINVRVESVDNLTRKFAEPIFIAIPTHHNYMDTGKLWEVIVENVNKALNCVPAPTAKEPSMKEVILSAFKTNGKDELGVDGHNLYKALTRIASKIEELEKR